MAVYTHVSSEQITEFLKLYDVGNLISVKGIAEGVENSNYFIETTNNKFILTLYEKRVETSDLPFFFALLDHLAEAGQPVPPAVRDRNGKQIQTLLGKSACLIEFLPGVSPDTPSSEQAHAAGKAMAGLHKAATDFTLKRTNTLSLPGWHDLADRCGDALHDIEAGLAQLVTEELAFLDANWPKSLPTGAIHADLFPDNVLMLGNEVTGVIDFYFACTDIRAYDLAVTHTAWCFSDDGTALDDGLSAALLEGYHTASPLSAEEGAALPILARGAALRFLLTRCWDWLNTPPDALVTRKDPLAFLHRLQFYRGASSDLFAI